MEHCARHSVKAENTHLNKIVLVLALKVLTISVLTVGR